MTRSTALFHVWVPFTKGVRKAEASRFYRELYGHNSPSNYGRYHYKRRGLLDSIPSVRYERGIFLVRAVDAGTITEFLKKSRVKYRMWRVTADKRETKLLDR
jgi:hypothetical protein